MTEEKKDVVAEEKEELDFDPYVAPDFVLSRPVSFKELSIIALDGFINTNNEELRYLFDDKQQPLEVKALFVTKSGVIVGEITRENAKTASPLGYYQIAFNTTCHRIAKEGENPSISGVGSYIKLKDVQIRTNSGHLLNLNSFILFTEDVVGFWVVPKDLRLD